MIEDEINISPITSLKNPVARDEGFADGTYEDNILKASCEGSNEEDFYDMLDKFGKYTPSAEKVKIQKTVDSIKKKYVQSGNGEEKSPLATSFVKESVESCSNSGSMTSSGNGKLFFLLTLVFNWFCDEEQRFYEVNVLKSEKEKRHIYYL